MKILVTGGAGFIGSYVAKVLIEKGDDVVIIDNINDYYDVKLKYSRLERLGINESEIEFNKLVSSVFYDNCHFIKMNLEYTDELQKLFEVHKFDRVCNLAAQAGVRYSLENPNAYIESNVYGFMNILECCRKYNVGHLVYASSSSVYGLNGEVPFSETHNVDSPASLYAATKKSNELMAHVYSHLFDINTIGLRFFTVYGPWGRPDMSPFLFTDAILNDRPINVFNNGDMYRDFTYVDDIVEGTVRAIYSSQKNIKYNVYNIGNSSPVKLMDYIKAIEEACGKNAKKIFLPMQDGDVYRTYADTSKIEAELGYKPSTPLEKGVQKTVNWYKSFYNLK